ncbi:MAG: WYL domain-containing protein [Acidobacteria bacterium]|nr:WYL domain-containing protein [Acidobacteriota bacterium]
MASSSANVRLERLLNLTAALLTTSRPLTSADIAERVPGYPDPTEGRATFQRAFERDKEALRDMGIPVTLIDLPGSEPVEQGYQIKRQDYVLRDPGLEADELGAIHLALAAVRLDGLPGTQALWKLGGAPEPGTGTATLAAIPSVPQLVPLFGAIAQRAPVRFSYRGGSRLVDPYRLAFSRGHWYLDGRDHDRDAPRQFRLDRVDGDVELGEPGSFERPATMPDRTAQPWELGGDEPVLARMAIDAEQARWAVDQLGPAAVAATRPDGSIVVEVAVSNRDGFRSFVLGFLDHAEVLAPPDLRDDLVAWLTGMVGG